MPGCGQYIETLSQTPLLVIVGPTASGKSDLALSIAAHTPAEIIGCDSVQIYRYFDIGSGKLPLEERRGVPHHLIDVVDPDQPFTAGEYARQAREAAASIASRGRLPVVVGGTGFYLKALLEGLCPAPPQPGLRERLTRIAGRRPYLIHRMLEKRDPGSAARIHPNDVQKAQRALEVAWSGDETLSDRQQQGRDPLHGFRILKVGLAPPRPQLRDRIGDRCAAMFAGGLIEETQSILARGFPSSYKPFLSLGYAQALSVINGELTTADALISTQIRTRQYAKRQMTWFRREPDVTWFETFGTHPDTTGGVLQIVHNFLNYTHDFDPL